MPDFYQQGTRLEYDVKFMLERDSDPWFCIRSAGSHGIVDLVAMWKELTMMIQCKKGSDLMAAKRVVELTTKCKELHKTPVLAYKIRIDNADFHGVVIILKNLINKEILNLWPIKAVRGLQEIERENKKLAKSNR